VLHARHKTDREIVQHKFVLLRELLSKIKELFFFVVAGEMLSRFSVDIPRERAQRDDARQRDESQRNEGAAMCWE
jgi:hypothetical protein